MKVVMAGLVVVMAFSAVAASGASAASWRVGGSELVGSASLAPAVKMVEEVRLEWYGGAMIRCAGVELKSASIVAPSGGSAEHLVFKGCGFISGSCSLKGTTIESRSLVLAAALGGSGPEDALVVKPASGKVLAEFTLTGASCARAGVDDLTGKVTLVLPSGREELVEQEVSMRTSAAGEELRLDGETGVSLKGAVKAGLVSGKAWSFS
jgi:hypothetical protein